MPEKGDSLKARLIMLMRSNNVNLAKASGRLLLMLCKDNGILRTLFTM